MNVCVATHEVDTAFKKYDNMGFNLTPTSMHVPGEEVDRSKAEGHQNRYAMFSNKTYFEVLNVGWQGRPGGPIIDSLVGVVPGYEKGMGLYDWLLAVNGPCLGKIMFEVPDLQRFADRARQFGWDITPEIARQNRVWTSGYTGREHIAPMDILTFPFEEIFKQRNLLSVLNHIAPEESFVSEYLDHPNTATGMSACVIVTADPVAAAKTFENVLDVESTDDDAGRVIAFPNGTRLEFATPAQAAARYNTETPVRDHWLAVICFSVRDIGAAQEVLRGNGVAYSSVDGKLIIEPELGAGARCVFETA